eukprot:jgi/Chrzof1/9165/Cz03g38120.t1
MLIIIHVPVLSQQRAADEDQGSKEGEHHIPYDLRSKEEREELRPPVDKVLPTDPYGEKDLKDYIAPANPTRGY